MTDEATAEIMEFYGKGGIPGVTVARARRSARRRRSWTTRTPTPFAARSLKRAAPFSYVDKSGWCYLEVSGAQD